MLQIEKEDVGQGKRAETKRAKGRKEKVILFKENDFFTTKF